MTNLSDIPPFNFKQANVATQPGDVSDFIGPALLKFNYNFSIVAQHLRENLLTNRVYYVSPSGSDSNAGLSETQPLRTIAKALEFIKGLNNNCHHVTIKLATGIYTESILVDLSASGLCSNTSLSIDGSVGTTISLSGSRYAIKLSKGAKLYVNNIIFDFISASDSHSEPISYIQVTNGSYLELGNVTFKEIPLNYNAAHILAKHFSQIQLMSDYQILGGATNHINAQFNSYVGTDFATVVNVSANNVVFNSLYSASQSSIIDVAKVSFNGSVSGAVSTKDGLSTISGLLQNPASIAPVVYNPTELGVIKSVTPEVNTNNTTVPTTEWVNALIEQKVTYLASLIEGTTGEVSGLPYIAPGTIFPFAGTTVPSGYLLCNGQEVLKSNYHSLFQALGTVWGVATDSTKFKLPDLRGRSLVGANPSPNNLLQFSNNPVGLLGGQEQIKLSLANLPPHKHNLTISGHIHSAQDSGHTHGLSDTYHTHSFVAGTPSPTGTPGVMQANVSQSNAATSPSFTGLNTIQPGFTGITIGTGYENITMAETGNGLPLSISSPFAAINYIIKY